VKGTRTPNNLFVVIVFLAFAKCLYDYPLLPDRLASHFGASGFPNGWMTKPAFFSFYAVFVIIAGAVGFLAPKRIAASSKEKIHLPNKDYWLAPERRSETMVYFRTQFGWYSCAFLLTEVIGMQLAIQANFHAPPRLATGPIAFLIGGFLFFNMIWSIQLIRHFSKSGE
jgi:uncharacterized membrane protein